jgi:tetratricopeptide (TPR) repeat protein
MLSTSKDDSECNGPEAVRLALEACEKSNWNCWAFLGTLAAAYAAAGDYERAVRWQQATLEIVPEDHRFDSEIILRHFQLGQRYIDEGQPPAAGGSGKDGDKGFTQLLRPEQNSKQTLQQLFQEAYLETETATNGDLFVIDNFRVLVTPSEEGETITLASIFRPRQHSRAC